jgi:hypothetical protein
MGNLHNSLPLYVLRVLSSLSSVILSEAKNPLQACTITGPEGSFHPLFRSAVVDRARQPELDDPKSNRISRAPAPIPIR